VISNNGLAKHCSLCPVSGFVMLRLKARGEAERRRQDCSVGGSIKTHFSRSGYVKNDPRFVVG
jgi:hypothetical protein